jgi:hypothetical protein
MASAVEFTHGRSAGLPFAVVVIANPPSDAGSY